jgi:hypothetical protein
LVVVDIVERLSVLRKLRYALGGNSQENSDVSHAQALGPKPRHNVSDLFGGLFLKTVGLTHLFLSNLKVTHDARHRGLDLDDYLAAVDALVLVDEVLDLLSSAV